MEAFEREGQGDRQSITDLLVQLRGGSPEAMNRLLPLVYGELRRIAHRQLQVERAGHTLSTTGLVHETYSSWWIRPGWNGGIEVTSSR